jgi:hypothetical protein
MLVTTLLLNLLSVASWTAPVLADLGITADHHSWGGVNYPMLQFFTPKHRDDTIRELVAAKVRVVRLFSMSFSATLKHKGIHLHCYSTP